MSNTIRRKAAIAVVVLVGLALFLWWRESTIVREGELYEIQAQGQVFDVADHRPIPDAWVLIGLHTSNSTIAGYGGGCWDGSAVVKTDANGHFSYRATVQKAGNGRSGFWTVVYHPEYAGEHTWGPPSVPGVSTFPIRHPTDGAPLAIGLAKRNIDEWEALKGIDKYAQQACLLWPFSKGHAEFSRMRFERTFALHCGRTAREGWFPLVEIMRYLEARLYEQAADAQPEGPESLWQENKHARGSYVASQLLPEYPWESAQDYRYPPRDLTPAEKTAFCSFYSQPIETLINTELLP